MTALQQQGAAAKAASRVLAMAGTAKKNEALEAIAAALTASYGRLRAFELLGAFLGAALFLLGVRPPLERLFRKLSGIIRRAFQKIANFRLIKVIFK